MVHKRILVVDDNVDAADAVAVLLECDGHDVRTAYDGRSALDEVARWSPEVVVLDIGLPDMDGYELAREVAALALQPPPLLVALSGRGQEDDVRRARDAGFAHHLLKPADPAALSALLAEPVHG